MLYANLYEVATRLEIPVTDTREQANLGFWIRTATNWINEILNRDATGLGYQTRTRFYKGTGSQKLTLRDRPVFPSPTDGNSVLTVYVDEAGYWGSAPGSFDPTTSLLVYGQDYALDIDQADGSSRSAILYRINDYWPRPNVRTTGLLSPYIGPPAGNVKVVSTAGFTEDTLPDIVTEACVFLTSRIRYIYPLGVEFTSDAGDERSLSIVTSEKTKLLALVRPMLIPFYRNWKW